MMENNNNNNLKNSADDNDQDDGSIQCTVLYSTMFLYFPSIRYCENIVPWKNIYSLPVFSYELKTVLICQKSLPI